MPTSLTRLLVVVAAASLGACLLSCKKGAAGKGADDAAPVALKDPAKAPVVRDLKADLSAARTAIVGGKNPVYALDRLALAAKELSEEKDPGVLQLLSDAEAVYGLQGPVAWADSKLKEVEADPPPAPEKKGQACVVVRDMLNRVTPQFKDRSEVGDVVSRFKTSCPRNVLRAAGVGGGSSGGGGGGGGGRSFSGPDPRAQRDACRRRCDDAAFSCRSSCMYCGSCVSDKTWQECNNICNTCRQGCEQNEKFCRAACGPD